VAGLARDRLPVGRVRGEAALVADRGRPDTGLLPECLLLAPETAQRELRDLESVGIRAADRRPEDRVVLRLHDRVGSAGERLVGGGHGGRAEEELHAVIVLTNPFRAMTME
jgi:hypothetical protein